MWGEGDPVGDAYEVPVSTPEEMPQPMETPPAEQHAEDITRRYLDDIGRQGVLGAREEEALARRMRAGDQRARSLLITHNLKLVVHMAKRYRDQGLPLLDLIEEGNLGLMHGLDKFDPDRGVRLSTYAGWWIRQAMELALMNQSRTIRLPVHVAKALNRCLRARRSLDRHGLADADSEAIAAHSGVEVERVRQLLMLGTPPVSLDTPLDHEPGLTVGDAIADRDAVPPEERRYQSELEDQVSRWLAGLPQVQRRVIEGRFGLGGREEASLAQLGDQLGLSAERVRQIQQDALKALAAMLHVSGFPAG